MATYCCMLWGRKNEMDGVDGMAASISRRASIGRGHLRQVMVVLGNHYNETGSEI